MLIDKWELLKEYVEGMAVIQEGPIKKALQKVQIKMDILDKKEAEEHDRLMNIPTVQDNRLVWEKEE
jgi:hypothetical protein